MWQRENMISFRETPTCFTHKEPLQGICIYTGRCDNRLLCRKCRKSHTNIHPPQLTHYEELDDLTSGKIVKELIDELNTIIRRIHMQNENFAKTNKTLVDQIDNIFKATVNKIVTKLDESKKNLIDEVLKNAKSNETIEHQLLSGVAELGAALTHGFGNSYQGPTLEQLVRIFTKNLSFKAAIENDNTIFSPEEYISKVNYLSNIGIEQLFINMNHALEKIDKDIIGAFAKEARDINSNIQTSANTFRRIENEESPLNISREEERPNPQIQNQPPNQPPSHHQSQPQTNSFLVNIPQSQPQQEPPQTNTITSTQNRQLGQNASIFSNTSIFNPPRTTEISARTLFESYQNMETGHTSPLINVDYEFLRPARSLTPPPYAGATERIARDEETKSDIGNYGGETNRSTTPPPNLLNQSHQNRQFESQRRLFEDASSTTRNLTGLPENSNLMKPLNFFSDHDMPRYMGKSSPFDAMRINHPDGSTEPNPSKKRYDLTGGLSKVVSSHPILQGLYENPEKSEKIPYNPAYPGSFSNTEIRKNKRKQKKRERLERKLMNKIPQNSPPRTQREPRTTSPQQILNIFTHVNKADNFKKPNKIQQVFKKVTIDSEIKAEEEEEENDEESRLKKASAATEMLLKNFHERSKKKNTVFSFNYSYKVPHMHVRYTSMVFVPNFNHIVTGGEEGKIMVYNSQNHKKIHEFAAHQGEINFVYYLREKEVLITSADNTVSVWDYDNGFNLLGRFMEHAGRIFAVEYIPTLNLMVTGGEDEFLRLWYLETFKGSFKMKIKGKKIYSLCFIPNLDLLAVGFDNGQVNMITVEPQQKKIIFSMRPHDSPVRTIKLLKDNNLILFTCGGSEIKAFRIEKNSAVFLNEYNAPGNMIQTFDFSKERNLMISSLSDRRIYIWKLSNGDTVHVSHESKLGEPLIIMNDRNFGSYSNNEVHVWKLI